MIDDVLYNVGDRVRVSLNAYFNTFSAVSNGYTSVSIICEYLGKIVTIKNIMDKKSYKLYEIKELCDCGHEGVFFPSNCFAGLADETSIELTTKEIKDGDFVMLNPMITIGQIKEISLMAYNFAKEGGVWEAAQTLGGKFKLYKGPGTMSAYCYPKEVLSVVEIKRLSDEEAYSNKLKHIISLLD